MAFAARPVTRPGGAPVFSRLPNFRNQNSSTRVKQEDPILIAVLGVTGAGKSTFINTAAGIPDAVEVGHTIFSCTSQVAALHMEVDGRPVVLIDTPGFDDTNLSDGDVLAILAEWLGIMYENHMLLTGVILLQPVDGNRAYGSEARRTKLFRQICGQDTYENVVIATTMWGNLRNRAEGENRVRQRQESGDFWANLVNNGEGKSAKIVEYHNNKEQAHDIIRMIMNKKKKPLQLQVELHASQGRLIDTTAGQLVDTDLGMEAAKKINKLHELNKKQSREFYKEDIKRLEEEIKTLNTQKEAIKKKKLNIDRIPPWISAFAGSAAVVVSGAAIVIPIALAGNCNIM